MHSEYDDGCCDRALLQKTCDMRDCQKTVDARGESQKVGRNGTMGLVNKTDDVRRAAAVPWVVLKQPLLKTVDDFYMKACTAY